MDQFENLNDDKELFPHEYGVERWNDMVDPVLSLLDINEPEVNFDLTI